MATRETELYKDKVEVSLDGRQIFYLFFGGAVIVGIVFVLGVLVGRRVEARGHIDRARTNASADPLAALDRLDGSDAMAFRGALSGKDSAAPVDKEIAELSTERGIVKPPAPAKATEQPVVEKKKADEKKTEAKVEKSEKKTDEKSEKKTDEKKSDDKKSEAKVEEKKPERFTLQLSSFQDKAEAEAYLAKVKDQGFTAQITQAQVDGKGTFYRVRMGSYKSLDSANSAKTDFEKSGRSASVMKL